MLLYKRSLKKVTTL